MPSNLDDHDFIEDEWEANCCDNPLMSEEDGFYICLQKKDCPHACRGVPAGTRLLKI